MSSLWLLAVWIVFCWGKNGSDGLLAELLPVNCTCYMVSMLFYCVLCSGGRERLTLKALLGSGGIAMAAPVIWSCMSRAWSAATRRNQIYQNQKQTGAERFCDWFSHTFIPRWSIRSQTSFSVTSWISSTQTSSLKTNNFLQCNFRVSAGPQKVLNSKYQLLKVIK